MSDCLLFLYIFWSFLKNILLMVNLSDWTVCSVPERWFILRRRDDRVVKGFVRIQNVPIDLSWIITRCDTIRVILIYWYTSRPAGWSPNTYHTSFLSMENINANYPAFLSILKSIFLPFATAKRSKSDLSF